MEEADYQTELVPSQGLDRPHPELLGNAQVKGEQRRQSIGIEVVAQPQDPASHG